MRFNIINIMSYISATMLLGFVIQSYAGDTAPSQRKCIQLGAVYQATAQVRNEGETPKEALSYISSLYRITSSKPNAKERLIVLPAKLSMVNDELKSNIETVLAEKLKHKYVVIAGVAVEAKLSEIRRGRSFHDEEPDKSWLLQTLAKSLRSVLVVETEVTNMANGDNGYYLNIALIDAINHKVIFSSGQSCQNCDTNNAIEMLKQMVGAYIEKEQGNLELSEKRVKQIINQVYFDPAFRFAGGSALQMQIYQICMGTYRPMEPLK